MERAGFVLPEGLRVTSDGAWHVGKHQVIHPPSLRFLKAHLVFEDGGAFVVDGGRRVPVTLEGPPFQVTTLVFLREEGAVRAVLDDGSEELLGPASLGMDAATGRFECRVRGGRARALLGRNAHQALLANVEEVGGAFALRVGAELLPIRT